MPRPTTTLKSRRIVHSLPPILRRSYRVTCVLAFVTLNWIAVIGLVSLSLTSSPWRRSTLGGSLAGLVLLYGGPFILFAAYWVWMMRFGAWARVRRRLPETRFCICGHCGQALRGLAAQGLCPECGSPYDAARLQSFWQRWARPPRRGNPALHHGRHHPWPARIFAIVVALGATVALGAAFDWSPWMVIALIPSLGWIAMMLWNHEHLELLKRRAALAVDIDRSGAHICQRCGWAIFDDAPTGRCLLCRKQYDLAALREHWRRERPPHWEIEFGHEQA